jgi:hypothetical protein
MEYLLWYDDSKKPTPVKIAEAALRYRERYGIGPNTILVNAADVADVPGLTVRAEAYVRRNNFWIGREPS